MILKVMYVDGTLARLGIKDDHPVMDCYIVDGVRSVSYGNTEDSPERVLTVKFTDGTTDTIPFTSNAYLMNNEGKTIQTFKYLSEREEKEWAFHAA